MTHGNPSCGGRVADQALQEVESRYPTRLTPYLEELIAQRGAPISSQFLPDRAELLDHPELHDDPLDENRHAPLAGLVHRHGDRALLLATNRCAALCRFCFRKGRRYESYENLGENQRDELFAYLAQQRDLREVILTGGDPLMLAEGLGQDLLQRLDAIGHLELLRIHSRLPLVDPGRVTAGLISMLHTGKPLYLMLHANHPAELTPQLAEACRRLSAAGIPLGSQTVLLKGVNDAVPVLEELFRGLLRLKVRPYYLHHPDLAAGTGHFRVSLERGRALVAELATRLSGLALPRYVVDLPGGRGKVPVEARDAATVMSSNVFRDDHGELVQVPDWEE